MRPSITARNGSIARATHELLQSAGAAPLEADASDRFRPRMDREHMADLLGDWYGDAETPDHAGADR